MSHLDGDDGNRDEYLWPAKNKVPAKLSLNIMMTNLSNHGEAGDSGEQTATEEGTNLLHLRRRPLLLLPTLHLNPLGVVQRPKKPANLLPMPFRKTSHCLQASTSRPNEPFSCVIVCLLDVCTTLSRVPPRSSWKAYSGLVRLMRLSTSTSSSLESLKVCS